MLPRPIANTHSSDVPRLHDRRLQTAAGMCALQLTGHDITMTMSLPWMCFIT